MLRRRLWFVVLAAALASSGVLLAPAASASSPDSLTAKAEPALTVGTVLGGLQNPWDMAFTPAGSILFTERTGPIKFRIVGGEVRQLARPADVVAQGEGGMMGVAIDPKFGTNRRVYTCFMSNKSGALDVRVVRWTINSGVTALTNRTDIVTGIPVSSGRHSGCRPRFGPDGRLWIGTGDAAVATNPQDPQSLGGKVLRVDTNGKGVAGNAPAPFDPRIYTYGHRNVQGLAFNADGQAFSIEHGTGRDDEVNRLYPGANYGWDPRPASGPLFYDESRPMTDKTKFPNAITATWSSGNPTIAPSGGTFLSGSQWQSFQGCLAMAVLKDQHLRILCLNGAGTTVVSQTVKVTDQGRLRVAVINPSNKKLYLTTDANPGKILRVVAG